MRLRPRAVLFAAVAVGLVAAGVAMALVGLPDETATHRRLLQWAHLPVATGVAIAIAAQAWRSRDDVARRPGARRVLLGAIPAGVLAGIGLVVGPLLGNRPLTTLAQAALWVTLAFAFGALTLATLGQPAESPATRPEVEESTPMRRDDSRTRGATPGADDAPDLMALPIPIEEFDAWRAALYTPDIPWDDIAAWRAEDPDSDTVLELNDLSRAARKGDKAAETALLEAFGPPLEFGTAGLRGPLGAGPARMNRVTVTRAAAALAGWLADNGMTGGRVIVGYDARHKSAEFARDTAEVLAGAGFEPHLATAPLPTPLVSFGVRHLGCVAGVMVTASHNPATDNGYKVYLADGCQIVSPVDTEIAARMAALAEGYLDDIPRGDAVVPLTPDLLSDYVSRGASLLDRGPRHLRWVHTALHGVSAAPLGRLVRAAGFPPPLQVPSQQDPDPDFPTLPFPNPEEPSVLSAALELARTIEADIVIANDPDGDRCAVAIPVDGTWRLLTGDEVGALLADDMLRRGVTGTYACSIVSGTLLGRLAAAYGQPFTQTLTGFKWIGRVPGLVFGYEEAIGYACDPTAVPDKDGLTAAMRVLALAAELKEAGQSLADRLDDLTRTYGLHVTGQLTIRVSGRREIAALMGNLRSDPPAELAGEPVAFHDFRMGGNLPPTDAVAFEGEWLRVFVRPSGTEPKLKCYYEFRVSPQDSTIPAIARRAVFSRLGRVRDELGAVLGVRP